MVTQVSLVQERPAQGKSSATVVPASPKGGRKSIGDSILITLFCGGNILGRHFSGNCYSNIIPGQRFFSISHDYA